MKANKHADVVKAIATNGFAIMRNIFSDEEIAGIVSIITMSDQSGPVFRKTKDLFAIRQVFNILPELNTKVFNAKLRQLLLDLFGADFFVVKSIYFDKPEYSNWFVAYHQDLTISVDQKHDLDGYGSWTVKHGQFAVQPPLSILQDNFTIRIHLDDTTNENGALKVITGSHLKGIIRPETVDWSKEVEEVCSVEKGGVMFMKPLLLHASGRTTNHLKRRVLHIEFSRCQLPAGIHWSESMQIS